MPTKVKTRDRVPRRLTVVHCSTRGRSTSCLGFNLKMIYNLYIFDHTCACLYHEEWNRNQRAQMSQSEEFKLVYGLIYSIKSFSAKLSPREQFVSYFLLSSPEILTTIYRKEGFIAYKTNAYKLHFFETPTGLKFVLNTDPMVGNIRDVLRYLYSHIYVDYVIRNPLHAPGLDIANPQFVSNLQRYIRSLTIFS